MSRSKSAAIQVKPQQAARAAQFLKGLANAHRLRLLCRLAAGEACVGALIEATGLPQTSVSQHLARLQRAGVVTCHRAHRLRIYRLTHPLAEPLLGLLHAHYCAPKHAGKIRA